MVGDRLTFRWNKFDEFLAQNVSFYTQLTMRVVFLVSYVVISELYTHQLFVKVSRALK